MIFPLWLFYHLACQRRFTNPSASEVIPKFLSKIGLYLTRTYMITSCNGSISCVIGPLWGESIGHRWTPYTKAIDAELWCFLWSAPEQTTEQTIYTPLIWDAIALIMTITVINTTTANHIHNLYGILHIANPLIFANKENTFYIKSGVYAIDGYHVTMSGVL